MITKSKILIYQKFNGDIDGWARCASKKEQSEMNDEDWYLIEELINEISNLKNNNPAVSFTDQVNEKLHRHCDSTEVINLLKSMNN